MRPYPLTPFALASILLLQSQAVLAQSDEEELSAIYGDKSTVSIATGTAQSLRRAPAVATVITAEDISAMGAYDLSEVLEAVPGLHTTRDGGAYKTNILMRGVTQGSLIGPQIRLTVNGENIANLYHGDIGAPFVGFPLQNIARIEVIRGPGSALYGADAYAGVINIITKTAADTPGTEFGLRFGSQKTKNLWAQHGGKIGKVDVAAFLSLNTTDGISETITADAATRNDSIFKTQSSLAPGKVNNHHEDLDFGLDLSYENWRFLLTERIRDNIGSGAGYSSALDPVSRFRSERTNMTLNWRNQNLVKDWLFNASFTYMNAVDFPTRLIPLLPPGTRLPTGPFPNGMIGGPGRWERQARLAAYANYTGFKEHQIRVGLGHEDMELYKTTTFKNFLVNAAGTPVPQGEVKDYTPIQPHILPQRRKLNYFYIQDEWSFAKDWVLTAGVRYDRYSDFGSTTNPRLALVWDTTPSFTNKLLYGRAFRAPSFSESYGINPVANGNPKLGPETISTVEWAGSWQATNNLQLNMNVFKFNRKNVIVAITNSTPGTGSTYANFGNQQGKGLEVEFVWDINRSLHLTGNYSYQRNKDEKVAKDVGYAPHHHLYTRVDWRFANGWQLNSQLNWIADRDRAAGDARPQISDYKTLDLTLRTSRMFKQWDISLSVKNLFNVDVREPSVAPGLALPNDLPMARRTIYFQGVYKL